MVRVRLLAGLSYVVLAAVGGGVAAGPSDAASGATAAPPAVAHPDLWPRAHSPAAMTDAETEAFVTRLMAHMTVEEKVGQTIQADISTIKPEDLRTYPLGSILAGGNSSPAGNDKAPAGDWLAMARAFRALSLETRPGHTPIPVMFGIDAVHGHNNIVGATLFPHNIGLGATRDPDLIRRIGEATAEEVAVTGADWTFGPTVAVPRDDRWGRTYEGYGEDPQIVRSYAGPMTLGLQGQLQAGEPLAPGHIAGSAKHFLADGGNLGGKDQGDAPISEADLVRLHAQGYPPAIDAGVLTVMASFSSWNGVKHHGNTSLLTDVLKGRMGFDGFVVGDWNAHGQVPGCSNESCPTAMNAGLDMFMAPDSWKALYANTLAQVRSGEIPMARLDDAVRRILRVKVKAGLFETARPLEGRFERLGAPDHRALAREAVRKSLVLLKNDGVLPIKAQARVLVAGAGADDIGMQSGGWTLSWQGTGNTNADFPHGQSIWGGIRDAVAAGGGTAELSVDGGFRTKPDVAVVVFGEQPYAEFQGDIPTVEFQPGAKKDLALLKKLKAQGVPVVAVFLSGRPLWVNPEINASDAFVAAWLPGSEGGGVADVLIRKPDGSINHDFRGKLSYSWPKRADQSPLNAGDPGYDPLFPFGYGLTYADRGDLAPLSEDSGLKAAATANTDVFFKAGRAVAPFRLALADAGGTAGEGANASPKGVVSVRAVDAGAQESGRAASWSGGGQASLALEGPPVDLKRQTNGDMAIALRYRLDLAPTAPVELGVRCGGKCGADLDATALFKAAPVGEWRTVKVKLACFRESAADMSRVTAPFVLTTSGRFGLSFASVEIVSNTGDAVCP